MKLRRLAHSACNMQTEALWYAVRTTLVLKKHVRLFASPCSAWSSKLQLSKTARS